MKVGLEFGFAVFVIASTSVSLVAGQRGGGHSDGRGAVHVQPAPVTPSGLSISRPIGSDLSSVRTNPPLGMDATPVPAPFAARPGTYTRSSQSRGSRSSGIAVGYGFGVPAYADTRAYGIDTVRPTADRDATDGVLFLDVSPRSALVFVDTAYVGSVGDLTTTGVRLSRGRHWVDLESPEFDTKSIEVTIAPGQPLRYQTELTPTRRAAAIVIPPRPPQTMYAIPGCYGGNRPPVSAMLPPGCDIAKVRVLRPQQRTN